MNKIILAGHLGADPDQRVMPDGTKVTNLRLAVNVWQKGGDTTIWYSVSCWGSQFDKIMPHLKKGSAVFVTGNLKPPRIYSDRDGQPKTALDVDAVSIEFPKIGKGQQDEQSQSSPYDQGSSSAQSYQFPGAPERGQAPAHAGGVQDQDDDLPF